MSTYSDASGNVHKLSLDVFLLDELRKEVEIDLASAESLAVLERDPVKLAEVALRLIVDPIDGNEFKKAFRGEAIARALAAVMEAVEAFFPREHMSRLQSHLSQAREAEETFAGLLPMLRQLGEPGVPPEAREAFLGAIGQMIGGLIDGDASDIAEKLSVFTPEATPSTSDSSLPDSLESTPAG